MIINFNRLVKNTMEEMASKSMPNGMVVGIIFVVAIVFGAGMYLYANNKATIEKENLNTQITALQKEVSDIKQADLQKSSSLQNETVNPSANTPTTTDKTSDSSNNDWKTYTNIKYGYEIKYPSNWYLYSDDSSDVSIQPNKEVLGGVPGPHADAFEIKVKPMEEGKSLSEMAKANYNQAGINFIQKPITIAAIEGLKTTSDCEGVGCGAPEWFVAKDGKLYDFNSNLGYSVTFDQILSTFKFSS